MVDAVSLVLEETQGTPTLNLLLSRRLVALFYATLPAPSERLIKYLASKGFRVVG